MRLPQPRNFRSTDDSWQPRPWRWAGVTEILIVVCVVVFVAQGLSDGRLTEWGEFTFTDAVRRLQLWRWVTTGFLHAGPSHLIQNLFGLWFFGTSVEWVIGRWRTSTVFLIGVLGGAGAYVALFACGYRGTSAAQGLIGASAGVLSVAAAAAVLIGRQTVRLVWPPVTVRIRTIVWFYAGLAALTILSHGFNAGGETAHLGGLAVGWLLAVGYRRLHRPKLKRRFWRPGDPAANFIRDDVR